MVTSDDGAIGLATAMMAAVMIIGVVVVIDIAAFTSASARAQTAADLAALAAAGASWTGDVPRTQAERVAAANGARMTVCACAADAATVEIVVRVPVDGFVLGQLGFLEVQSSARAMMVGDPVPFTEHRLEESGREHPARATHRSS